MTPRIIINIGFFISILLLPWWISAGLALVGVFFVDKFYELVIWGGIYDLMFGISIESFNYWGIVLGALLLLVSFWLKKSFARNM